MRVMAYRKETGIALTVFVPFSGLLGATLPCLLVDAASVDGL